MSNYPRAFVTGDPIEHSRSPIIHNFWLKAYNIAGSYEPVLKNVAEFTAFIKNLSQANFCGGNVTLPHKLLAYHLADICDEAAQAIGAANTLWLDDGQLWASNSDAYGFLANLDEFMPNWGGKTALVLGAGGAARSIIYALKLRKFTKIIVTNRTFARAEILKAAFGDLVEIRAWQDRQDFVALADLIVNTTSVEMERKTCRTNQEPLINLSEARSGTIITDIVYTPLITPFLKQAETLGLKTVDGLGMLLHQAVPGFEKWFGIRPEVTSQLRNEVLASLNR